MGQKELVSKYILRQLAVDIAYQLLQLPIDRAQVELLETEQPRVEWRRADMVTRLFDIQCNQSFILHLEIQNSNDPKMPLRMLRYFTDIRNQWANERIEQWLLYIGRSSLTMPN